MKIGIISDKVFAEYEKEIVKKNYNGIVFCGLSFTTSICLGLLVNLIVNPEIISLSLIYYAFAAGVVVFLLKVFSDRHKVILRITEIYFYVSMSLFLFHFRHMYSGPLTLCVFAIVALSLSTAMIISPVYLSLGQLLLLAAVILGSLSVNGGILDINEVLESIIISLMSSLVGFLMLAIRFENMAFFKEIDFAVDRVEGMVSDAALNPQWSGRNKYGILSGTVTSTRRVFTILVDLTNDKVRTIRDYNIFSIKTDDKWHICTERIYNSTLDPGSRLKLKRLIEPSFLLKAYDRGQRRFSETVAFKLEDKRVIWTDIECVLRTHPITGNTFASYIVEDITEDHMMIGILNKIMEADYDYVMCIEPDRDLTITFSASKGEEIGGVYTGEYNKNVSQLIHEHAAEYDVDRALALSDLRTIKEALLSDEFYSFTIDEVADDGNVLKKQYRYTYLDPNKMFLAVAKKDITEILAKQSEAELEISRALKERENALNAKSDFMAKMSHEMRTPMNAIMGLSTLMQDEINHPKALREYVKKIQYSGHFLLQLINDVLDMSRMEDSQFKIVEAPYTFGEFWDSISMLVTPMCNDKKLDFEWKTSIPDDLVFKADALRLVQVFVNLLTNAIKYTPENGHVIFECHEQKRAYGRIHCRFLVRDDGIGMSEEFISHMFEPFAQEQKTVSKDLQGSGLGLAIVKNLVERMGGTITVKSKQGKGSVFTVMLDFEIVDENAPKRRRRMPINLDGRKVLVVEDNEINREIAVALLEKKGINVTEAENGKNAVEIFEESEPYSFDVILMDIRMPVMNGLEATRAIRSMDRPDALTVPIIAMTANVFESDVKASMEAGLNAHLAKPINPMVLYETIQDYIKE